MKLIGNSARRVERDLVEFSVPLSIQAGSLRLFVESTVNRTRTQRGNYVNSSLQAMPIEGRELGLARAIQNTLVPLLTYEDTNVEAYGQTIPREDLGGDLVDLVTAGRDIIAYVADVSGHGLPAAVLMGMVKTAVRYGLHLGQVLPVLLDGLNRLLPAVKEPNMYATLAGLRFDGSNEVEYITAGHVPLLQYRRRQRDIVRCCSEAQFPLGLFEDAGYVSGRVRYEAGDMFVLVTDGILEAADEQGAPFGFERLEQILCDLAGRPLSEIFEAVLAAVTLHGTQQDDQTLLLVRALASGRQTQAGLI
jgi:sigma-B regulation protein RsbU (phosphoserine phosphatase)